MLKIIQRKVQHSHGRVMLAQLCLLIVSVLSLNACSLGTQSEKNRLAQFSPDVTQSISIAKIQTWSLDNGMTVMFLPDPELPLVSAALYTQGGSLWETPQRIGAIEMMGLQTRQGGAGNLGPDELDAELERLAASISGGIGAEYGKFSMGCLSSDFEHVFELFADVVQRPRFAKERLNLAKGQTLEAIRRRVDDPNTIAGTSFGQVLYGPTVLGRVLLSENVKKITRTDMLAEYSRFVKPQGSILAVTGNIDRKNLEDLVTKHFTGWAPQSIDLGPLPEVNFSPKPVLYFVSMPFAQSTFIVGQQGIPRFTSDYVAIEAFNEIFGSGGFGSRLMKRVRSELGLAYGVYGAVTPARIQGKNFVYGQTKSESTAQALKETIAVLIDLQKNGATPSELQETKRVIRNSFVFKFGAPAEVLDRQVIQKLLQYPNDYDSGHLQKIEALQLADIQNVAQKRWNPGQFVGVVVGNEKAYSLLDRELRQNPGVLKGLELKKVQFKEHLEY